MGVKKDTLDCFDERFKRIITPFHEFDFWLCRA